MRAYDPSQDYLRYPTLTPLPEELTSCLAKCSVCGCQDFHIRLPGWTAVCKECKTVYEQPFTAGTAPAPSALQEHLLPFSSFQLIATPSEKWYDSSYLILRPDGTVRADQNLKRSLRDALEWTQIVCVVSNSTCIAGLHADGTVTAVGLSDRDHASVLSWDHITSIAATEKGIIALRSDGTLRAVGLRADGQAQLEKWSNISSIAVGRNRIAGLRRDGTLRAIGNWDEVYGWDNITAIASAGSCIAGLRENGTLVTAGIYSQAARGCIAQWKDIKSFSVSTSAIAAVNQAGKVDVLKYITDSPLTNKDIQLAQSWSSIDSVLITTRLITARRTDGFIHCTNPRIQKFIIESMD